MRAALSWGQQENIFPAEVTAPVPTWLSSSNAPPELKPLRPLQERAISAVKASLAAGNKRVILKSPTGSGKTVIGSHIIQSALAKARRVWFVVNAISLVDQTVEKFWSEGIRAMGVVQGDHEMTDLRQPVQVCSVQTLMRRKLPQAPDLILIDEAHNWFKFYEELFAAFPNVPIIGLTATPYTKGLGRYYMDLVTACTTQELIDQGLLSPFRVFAPSHPDLAGVRIVAGDYHEGDLSKAMDKLPLVADVVKTWLERAEGRPTFCYAVDRAHAKHLQERFQAAGVATAYVDAMTELDERRDILAKFRTGEVKVICNVGVLTTGIDADVRCIQLVRPTKSEILFQQIVGRGLRTAPGKDFCLILDHSDTHLRLGFVTDVDERNHELDDGKPKKTKPKPPAEPKECPSCHVLRPIGTRTCGCCGFTVSAPPPKANEIENAEGGLAEVKKRNRDWSAEQKRAFYGELMTYATAHAYKPGWAAAKFKERLGVWPNAYRDAIPEPISPETSSWIRASQIRWAKRRPNL